MRLSQLGFEARDRYLARPERAGLRTATSALADATRHYHPWAQAKAAAARGRGHDHPARSAPSDAPGPECCGAAGKTASLRPQPIHRPDAPPRNHDSKHCGLTRDVFNRRPDGGGSRRRGVDRRMFLSVCLTQNAPRRSLGAALER